MTMTALQNSIREAFAKKHNHQITKEELTKELVNLAATHGMPLFEAALLSITEQQPHQTRHHHQTTWQRQGFENWNDYDRFNHQWYKDD